MKIGLCLTHNVDIFVTPTSSPFPRWWLLNVFHPCICHDSDGAVNQRLRGQVRAWIEDTSETRKTNKNKGVRCGHYIHFFFLFPFPEKRLVRCTCRKAINCETLFSGCFSRYFRLFTLDVIASVAFGTDVDTFNNPNSPLIIYSNKISDFSFSNLGIWFASNVIFYL